MTTQKVFVQCHTAYDIIVTSNLWDILWRHPPIPTSHQCHELSLFHWPCKTHLLRWLPCSIMNYRCSTDLARHVLWRGGHSGSRTATTHMNISDSLWVSVYSVSMFAACHPLWCSWYKTATNKTVCEWECTLCRCLQRAARCDVLETWLQQTKQSVSECVLCVQCLQCAILCAVLDTTLQQTDSLWVSMYSVFDVCSVPSYVLFLIQHCNKWSPHEWACTLCSMFVVRHPLLCSWYDTATNKRDCESVCTLCSMFGIAILCAVLDATLQQTKLPVRKYVFWVMMFAGEQPESSSSINTGMSEWSKTKLTQYSHSWLLLIQYHKWQETLSNNKTENKCNSICEF